MKRLHIALAVENLERSIEDYTHRLGRAPVAVSKGQYALWRTPEVNLSISEKPEEAGQLRHLGFEDPSALAMTVDYDLDGFMWERFTVEQQQGEIVKHYPDTEYLISSENRVFTQD